MFAVVVMALVVAHCSLGLGNHLGKHADQCIALVVVAGAVIAATISVAGRASPWRLPRAENSDGLMGLGTPPALPFGRARAGPRQLQVFHE